MNVFELAASLSLDDSQYTKGLNKASKNANSFGTKLKKSFTTTMKAAGVAIAGAATAVAALTKTAVDAYANYEQLVGGVETLFGTGGKSAKEFADSIGKSVSDAYGEYKHFQRAQNEVLKNADNAYKTAGMSANQYMETVTSFSASLVQSLGGDTLKAAEYADKAIVQMSDNANKMGTSIDAIQNAYMGFAKQNYTMLDNLKLGYGGTKTEMERLITDAEKLDTSFKASRDSNGKLKMSYAEIVDAIQIVQNNMGITGTTAAEAEKTISGSLAMVKASWDNLLVGMASESGNFTAQMDALVESAATALDNIIPVVTRFLTGFGDLMKQVGPIIVDKLPQIIKDVVPSMLDAAVSIVGSLVDALPGILDAVVTVFGGLVDNIRNYLTARWPEVGNTFGLIADTAMRAFNGIVGFLKGVFSGDWEGAWNSLKGIAQGIKWGEIGTTAMNLVKNAWSGLKKWASSLWENAKEGIKSVKWTQVGDNIRTAIGKAWNGLKKWASGKWEDAKEGIKSVNWKQAGTEVKTAIAKIWDNLKGWATSIWKNARAGIENVDWKTAGDTAKTLVGNAWNALKGWATELWGKAKDGIESVEWGQTGLSIATKIANAVKVIVDWMKEKFDEAVAKIQDIKWRQLGENIWQWIYDGLGKLISDFKGKFTDAKGAVDGEIDWAGLGNSILTAIMSAFFALSSLALGFFKTAWEDIKNIKWEQLGEGIRDFIVDGLYELGEKMRGKAEEGYKNIEGLEWLKLGADIAIHIAYGMVMLPTYVVETVRDAIYAAIGEKELASDAGRQMVDAFMGSNAFGMLPPNVQQANLEAIAQITGSEYAYRLAGKQVGDSTVSGMQSFPAGVKEINGRVVSTVSRLGDEIYGPVQEGVKNSVAELSKIQKAIDAIKGKKITITADIKAGANAKVGSNGKITPMARAMDRGYIYRHATIFGYDHDNDTYQMAGDAGPEAVVGVHSLSNMIQESVNKAVGKTQSAMIGVLNKILDVMPKGDVVLDTGALVGGIAGEMNGELERLTAWSGGGRAL